MGKRYKTKQQQLAKRQENPKEWSTKKKVIIAYTALMVIYGFYTLVVSIMAYANFTAIIDAYNRVVDNLDNEIIQDVTVPTGTSCPSDYESAFDFEWKGTDSGCDCNDAPRTSSYENVSKKLYTGRCDTNQTRAGCDDVSSIKGKNFNLWNINSNPKTICFKRNSKEVYYKNVPENGKCSSSQKTCGDTNTPTSVYCVDSSQDCPVYELVIDSKTSSYSTNNMYEEISVDTNTALYVARGGSGQPLSEIRITQGGGVCTNNEKLNKKTSPYLLYKNEYDIDCKEDPRFMETQGLAEMSEVNYYTVNGVYSQLSSLPEISFASNDPFIHFQREFILWKMDNRKDLDKIVDIKEDVGSIESNQVVIMVINIIVCIVVSIILTISEVYNLMGKDVPCIAGDGEYEQKRIKMIKKITSYGSKLLQGPFLMWALISSGKIKGFLTSISDDEVSDSVTNSEVKKLADAVNDDVFMANVQMIVAFFFIVFVDLVMYLLKLRKRSKKKKNKVGVDGNSNEGGENNQLNENGEQEVANTNKVDDYQQEQQEQPLQQNQITPMVGGQQPNNPMVGGGQIQQPPGMGYDNVNQPPPQQEDFNQPPPPPM